MDRSGCRLRRGRLVAKVAAAGLAGAGVATIGYAILAQSHAPTPVPAAAGRVAPQAPGTPLGTPGPRRQVMAPPASQPAGASIPTAIDVAAIGVSSALSVLGLSPDGTLAVPSSFGRAGWYEHSAQCGQAGPTVVLGHVDSYTGPGVFFRLGALRPGDSVVLRCANGDSERFRITGVREYQKAAFPSMEVYGPTMLPTIRLVTCGGRFDHASGHYLSNVVAFGQLAGRT